MIDSIGKLLIAGWEGSWIIPLIVFLFYVFINISRVIAERKDQKLAEQPSDLKRPRHRPIDGPNYSTKHRVRNLPKAPKHDSPAMQKIPPCIQPQTEVKPAPFDRHTQTRVKQQDQPLKFYNSVQQISVHPDRKLFNQSSIEEKKHIPQNIEIPIIMKQSVDHKTTLPQRPLTAPTSQPRFLHLFPNSLELKKGILYAEILGKPIALKDYQYAVY